MNLLDHLLLGFQVALTPTHLLYSLFGVAIGTLIGVLPGIGSVAAIAMLLPVTFYLPPVAALIMLAGIYYGSQYGGSTAAILINLPGEPSAVVTCLDGHEMARQGRAGPALAIAAVGSFVAGCMGTLVIALFAVPLSDLALGFGSPEYFALMVLGLIAAVVLSHGSVIKAIGMVLLGLLLGLVGTDVNSGVARFAFGASELTDGINFVVVAIGLFGFADIITSLETKESRDVLTRRLGRLMPSRAELAASWKPMLRGAVVGSVLGVLPGAGGTVSSFASYTVEKRLSRDPSRFGRGAIEGVAGPESANNAAAQTSFIPLLTLGIPSTATTALMIGAMTMQGITPGPQVMSGQPDLFWGMIASMWIGNFMLLVLNLPLIGVWVRLLTVPYRLLYPAVLLLSCLGAYSLANSTFDVLVMAGAGLMGYLLARLGCEPAPLLLAFILGPLMEENLRRTMILSRGDPTIFFTRPVSLGLLVAAFALLAFMIAPAVRRKRNETLGNA